MSICGPVTTTYLLVSLLFAGSAMAGDRERPPRPKQAGPAGILARLEQTKVPEIDFRNAYLGDVVRFLSEASRNNDKSKVGINMIWSGEATARKKLRPLDAKGQSPAPDREPAPEAGAPTVTFHARYISLLEALKIVTQLTGTKYQIRGNIVMIVPRNAPDQDIQVRTYTVKPTVGDRIEAVREDMKNRNRLKRAGDF